VRPINNTRPVSLTDRVYAELVSAVVSRELAPGDKLTDRRLAEQLGVSRTPIREALQRMVQSGLAEPHGRAGWTVAALDQRDVEELFELRSLLEPAGIRHIIQENNAAAKEELLGFFDGYGDSVPEDRYEEYFGVDRSFHSRIVALSGNRRIEAAYRNVELLIDLGRHRLLLSTPTRVDQTLAEHKAIAAAIASGDEGRAITELGGHLSHGVQLLLDTFPARKPGRAARPRRSAGEGLTSLQAPGV
jgi:DNA-binding GntR family transcriptional regulator